MSFTRIRCFSFVAFGPSVLTYLQVIGYKPPISVTKCPLTLTANFAATSREKVIRYLRNSAPQIRQNRSAESSLKEETNTNASPDVHQGDLHSDLAVHFVSLINIKHASNDVRF